MSEFKVIDFGRGLLKEYSDLGNCLDFLDQEIKKSQSKFSTNDWAIIRCFFETDKEATFLIDRMETESEFSEWESEQHLFTNGMLSHLFLHGLKSAESLDRYFKCKDFFPQKLEIWKAGLGDRWDVVRAEAKEHCGRYPTLYSEDFVNSF